MAAGRAKLTDEHRAFIVQRLACFETPGDVAEAVRDRFGIQIAPQSVESYDHTKYSGKKRNLAKRWITLFDKARKAYRKDIESLPLANKAVRVRQLSRAAQAAWQRGNLVLYCSIIEQIAKEMGGSFTNQRQITGRDGNPVEFRDLSHLSDEELAARVNRILGLANEGSDESDE